MQKDLINRQEAIDAIMGQPPEPHYPSWYAAQIEGLPPAQPERKKDEWIPISKETNPTKSGWYLVTVHAEFDATNGMWYDIDEPTNMYLRWMPLPAPYEEGKTG